MATNEFPVAANSEQGTALASSEDLKNANNSNINEGANINDSDTAQSSTENNLDQGSFNANEAESKNEGSKSSKIKDFFQNGEVLRRFVILGFLVVFLSAVILGLFSLQSSPSSTAYRQLGVYNVEQIGKVLDFLNLQGYDYKLNGQDTILVKVDDYAKINDQMLRQGIATPQNNNDIGDSILMTDSGFGVSQRLEGERIKHNREIQLARAIERIDGVNHATVLLAIPKENVFAREISRPSAAVVVTLQKGSYLSPENVNSIRFMVSSSVHNLLAKDVSVTDQTGRLLSSENSSGAEQSKDQKEFELRTMREAQYRDKLDAILAPMLGLGNYSSEVDVTLDTTVENETRQIYNPDSQAVRSETLKEQRGSDEKTNPYGVPGSLSNQPPANAVIPQQLKDGTANGTTGSNNEKESREAVRNYEVDTTIRQTIRPTNVVSRLTVSVAVDYLRQVAPDGTISYVPRPQADLDKIAELVRGGLGLDERRGDFVRVETVSFPHTDDLPPLPWWQQESFLKIAKIAGAIVVILALVVFVIRPMVNRLIKGKSEVDKELENAELLDSESALEGNDDLNLIAAKNDLSDQVYSIGREGSIELPNLRKEEDLLKAVRTLVSNEPLLASEVVRDWMNSDLSEKAKQKA